MNKLESALHNSYESYKRGMRAVIRSPKYHPKAFLFVVGLALGTLSEQQGINRDVKNQVEGGARFVVAVADNAWFGARKTFADGFKVVGEWADPAPKRPLNVGSLGIKQY